MDGADPNAETLSANVNQNRDVTTGNHSSSGPADAESGYLAEAGNTTMICEWNHAQVVAFLEARPK